VLAFGFAVATLSVAFAADRIFTNPRPDVHLKRLFPQAVAFSPLQGTPLHFKAYTADPKTRPDAPLLGYAFWTTDIVPNERGYHAPSTSWSAST
jgi:transcriptional regulator of nitric oxide reductase